MSKLKPLILMSLFITAPSIKAGELRLSPFETDGCTLFIDGTNSRPGLWRHCCIEHDLRYWYGGSIEERDGADLQIRSCVEKAAGINWARVIYAGIRTGHYSPIKNKYQWSWGWQTKRENKTLSLEESNYVLKELRSLSVESVNIEDFIKNYFPSQKAL